MPDLAEPDQELRVFIFLRQNPGQDPLGQVQAAKRSYERALSVQPDMAEALKNLGRIYLDQGSYEKAEELLSRSLEIDAHYVQTHVNLGFVYLRTGR